MSDNREFVDQLVRLPYPAFEQVLARLNVSSDIFSGSMSPAEKAIVLNTLLSVRPDLTDDRLRRAASAAVSIKRTGNERNLLKRAPHSRLTNSAEESEQLERIERMLRGATDDIAYLKNEVQRLDLGMRGLDGGRGGPPGDKLSPGGGGDRPPRAFVCYNRDDKEEVKTLCAGLVRTGVYIERDEETFEGRTSFWQEIHAAIQRSDGLIIAVGAHGFSPVHQQEAEVFHREVQERNAPVMPVLLWGAPQDFQLPWFLRNRTDYDLRVMPYAEVMKKIYRALRPKREE